MNLVTLAPIRTHLSLKTGVNDQTEGFRDFLQSLAALDARIDVPGLRDQATDYQSLEQDVVDARLFVWREHGACEALGALPAGVRYVLRIHVYSNTVSVAEIRYSGIEDADAAALEQDIQKLSAKLIDACYPVLYRVLERLAQQVDPPLLTPIASLKEIEPYNGQEGGAQVLWVARAVVLGKEELREPRRQELVTQWLAETQRPEDARDLIEGAKSYSMTWLNYVLVETQADELAYLLDSMRMAQYFYAAQEICNNRLRNAISRAYLRDNLKKAEAQLIGSRIQARLLLIHYHELRKHLTRRKRRALDEIMAVWDFDQLVDNGQRMVEVCSSRLDDHRHQRRERSSLFTDLILVGIGFFAIFELSLLVSKYSRELMSRPALGYMDSDVSWVLSTIAAIDTDDVLLGSIVLVLALLGVYLYAKRR